MFQSDNHIDLYDFSSVAVSVASPETIHSWSHGEVTKPETINYRTQKPERDGLFCEKIFGPTKNWECYCGKYKKIKYKGIVCEKCGVEVTKSVVRRERMGHIDLAVPVAHIWYLRSTPSRIGLFLDMSIRQLEQVIGFSAYIVKSVDEDAKKQALGELQKEFQQALQKFQVSAIEEMTELQQAIDAGTKKAVEKTKLESEQMKIMGELEEEFVDLKNALRDLTPLSVLSEFDYVRLRIRFGQIFDAGIGAEALYEIISSINLEQMMNQLQQDLRSSTGVKHQKIQKRIKLVGNMMKSNLRPEWMILTVLPVLPPDLRPMVALDGGRFATSDLNDLYRRVINRNNRLRKLLDIGAPEVICRNEKRILQEAVDALIHNSGRGGKNNYASVERRKYKSLSDILRGKQGRFRQNLLGKRVDYSGRSVIVVNPKMRIHQCGLPKKMALSLFKPFVLGKLVRDGVAHNVKYAERMIEWNRREVWDALEEVTKNNYVLLNRAPTLHRLGIQAFQPILIDGKAIQIHPLVCAGFNADFDGDQMAVHVPLGVKAQEEAKNIMLSSKNLLKPMSGEPIINPSQDMILGCYFVTQMIQGAKGEGMVFSSFEEAKYAFQVGKLAYQAKIRCRYKGQLVETNYGRLLFQQMLPEEVSFQNATLHKGALGKLLGEVFEKCSTEVTARVADDIKDFGFQAAAASGVSLSIFDFHLPQEKAQLLTEGADLVEQVHKAYRYGLLTNEERYLHTIKIWMQMRKKIDEIVKVSYTQDSPLFVMVESKARGNWEHMSQIAGMRGLIANSFGKAIEVPVKSSLKEGFTVLEYFISATGGRKGKADTALKTASSGYLTRRLVDSVQDVIVREHDCGSTHGHPVHRDDTDDNRSFADRMFGFTIMEPVVDPETGEVLYEGGTVITKQISQALAKNDSIKTILVRSVMTCQTVDGVCQKCYGMDLSNHQLVDIGTPVGIIAAQSIGEPGTQLTMRTFQSGGVAKEEKDITQGLERVEELFECRSPKTKAEMADVSGTVTIEIDGDKKHAILTASELREVEYPLLGRFDSLVSVGDKVTQKQMIARLKKEEGKGLLRTTTAGEVTCVNEHIITIRQTEKEVRRYTFPVREALRVSDGDAVVAGQPLSYGHLNLRDLMRATNSYMVQKYITEEILSIYAAQGQSVSTKHIHVITRQMLSKVSVLEPGDTDFLPGDIVSLLAVLEANEEAGKNNTRPCTYERLLLGLTKTAISTDSWLSAASFQETIRVLIDASLTRKVDKLRGLKENVIIGRLIPVGVHYAKVYQEQNESTTLHEAS